MNVLDDNSSQVFVFEPLSEQHLPLLRSWLTSGFVSEWYKTSDSSEDGIRAKYLPKISGQVPVHCFIVHLNQEPIGFVQSYWYRNFPAPHLAKAIPSDCASLDVFLSTPSLTGKGLGSAVIAAFLKEKVFGELKASYCLVDPEKANHRALRAYQKVGFTPFEESGDTLFLILSQANFFSMFPTRQG